LLAVWLGKGRVTSLSEVIPSTLEFGRYMRLRYSGDKLCQVRINPPDAERSLGEMRLGGIGFVDLESVPPSLALLIWPPGSPDAPSDSALLCGPNAESLLAILEEVIKEWKALGSPGFQDLHIRVYQGKYSPELDKNAWAVPLQSATLTLRYGPGTGDEVSSRK